MIISSSYTSLNIKVSKMLLHSYASTEACNFSFWKIPSFYFLPFKKKKALRYFNQKNPVTPPCCVSGSHKESRLILTQQCPPHIYVVMDKHIHDTVEERIWVPTRVWL